MNNGMKLDDYESEYLDDLMYLARHTKKELTLQLIGKSIVLVVGKENENAFIHAQVQVYATVIKNTM
jgi:hypothetical protein